MGASPRHSIWSCRVHLVGLAFTKNMNFIGENGAY